MHAPESLDLSSVTMSDVGGTVIGRTLVHRFRGENDYVL